MFHLDVNRFIEEKSLFFQKDKILVALSGGADSVALLRVLLALGYLRSCPLQFSLARQGVRPRRKLCTRLM